MPTRLTPHRGAETAVLPNVREKSRAPPNIENVRRGPENPAHPVKSPRLVSMDTVDDESEHSSGGIHFSVSTGGACTQAQSTG
jgi:hypothetical protein